MRLISLVILLAIVQQSFGQFILGDAENRTSFLNTPSSLTLDAADDKLSLNINNLTAAKSRVEPFLWGFNYRGGSNNSNSFLWQGGKFVPANEASAFIGYSRRLDKGRGPLVKLIRGSRDDETYARLAITYNAIIDSFLGDVKWSESRKEEFKKYFFPAGQFHGTLPLTEAGATSLFALPKQVNLVKKPTKEIEFLNRSFAAQDYRKYLSTHSDLKLSQQEINDLRDNFLLKLFEKRPRDNNPSQAEKDILEAFKWVTTKYQADTKKYDALKSFFEIRDSGGTLSTIDKDPYYEMQLSFIRLPSDEDYFDSFLKKGFPYDEVIKIRDDFYIKMLLAKEVSGEERARQSELVTDTQFLVREAERAQGVWRGTAFLRGGLFGSSFTRIDTLVSQSMMRDSTAFADITFRGEFIELGFNFTGRGKWYFGLSYTFDFTDNFKDLSETEFAFIRRDTVGTDAFETSDKRSAFVGHYFSLKRRIFSFDAAYLIDLDPNIDSANILSPHIYFRHNENKSQFKSNEAKLGLGVNFYKKNTKFLFGLFVQKNDLFDDVQLEDEEFKDTIDIGVRAAYAFSKIDVFR